LGKKTKSAVSVARKGVHETPERGERVNALRKEKVKKTRFQGGGKRKLPHRAWGVQREKAPHIESRKGRGTAL